MNQKTKKRIGYTLLGLFIAGGLYNADRFHEKEEAFKKRHPYSTIQKTKLNYHNLHAPEQSDSEVYKGLLNDVEQNGPIRFNLYTKAKAKDQKIDFLGWSYGYGWASMLEGSTGKEPLKLKTSNVSKEDKIFMGDSFGYAWEKTLEGHMAGMPLNLVATEFGKGIESGIHGFYGVSSATEFFGEIGDRLEIRLRLAEASKEQEIYFGFPFGYGFPERYEAIISFK
jgi:hypothetical protein